MILLFVVFGETFPELFQQNYFRGFKQRQLLLVSPRHRATQYERGKRSITSSSSNLILSGDHYSFRRNPRPLQKAAVTQSILVVQTGIVSLFRFLKIYYFYYFKANFMSHHFQKDKKSAARVIKKIALLHFPNDNFAFRFQWAFGDCS